MSPQPTPPGHPELDRPFIERQRRYLEALRSELLGGERQTIASRRGEQEQHGGEAAEFEDDAQDSALNEVSQALHEVNERRIADIERALQKIGEGSYGLSDLSGQPIAKARLAATPEAVFTLQEERNREAGR